MPSARKRLLARLLAYTRADILNTAHFPFGPLLHLLFHLRHGNLEHSLQVDALSDSVRAYNDSLVCLTTSLFYQSAFISICILIPTHLST